MAEENNENNNNNNQDFLSRKDLSNLREAQQYQSQLLKNLKEEEVLKKELKTLSNDIASLMRKEVAFAEEKNESLRTAKELAESTKKTNDLIAQTEQKPWRKQ